METIDLKQRITHGENTTTEFKENFDQETIETAAAFANTDGGIILKKAFFYVQRHGQIATKEYVEINSVSRQTAYTELTDLTNKGLFIVIGKGRGTKYVRKVTD